MRGWSGAISWPDRRPPPVARHVRRASAGRSACALPGSRERRACRGGVPEPLPAGRHRAKPSLADRGADRPDQSSQVTSTTGEARCESTRASIRSVRPIQGSGRIALTQSAKLGMNPRSSRTCCSPTHRVGITRPVERVIVGPKTVSESQIPAACETWLGGESRRNGLLRSRTKHGWPGNLQRCRPIFSLKTGRGDTDVPYPPPQKSWVWSSDEVKRSLNSRWMQRAAASKQNSPQAPSLFSQPPWVSERKS